MSAIIVSIIYFCACLWLLLGIRQSSTDTHSQGHTTAGLLMACFGWVIHGYLLYRDSFENSLWAMNSTFVASLIAWVTAAITLVRCWNQVRFAGIAGALLLCVGLAAALTDEGVRNFSTSQMGWELTAHVLIAAVAYAFVAVGAGLGLALYLLDHRLRHHQALGWMKALPSMEALETSMFQAVVAGFALLTLTLFSGFIFVRDLLAQHLMHKVALSSLAWLILGTLLWGRWKLGWRGRTAARWTLWGFLLLGLSYFGAKFVLEIILGRHWG